MNPMKMKLGKRIAAFALGTLMLAAFAGCSTSGSGSSGSASTGDSGKIQIQFWHSMSGNTQEALDEVVAGFNESQDTYEVVATNQGSYDESTGKFFNMANGDGSAHIIQIGEQNLQSMIDSGMVASVSDLIEKHSFDDSDLLEQEVNFYTVGEDMWAMPFNCSTPVVYYNKTAFAEAGVTEFPTTFEGIKEAAQALADSGSNITPVGMYAYGYALDQMVINMGGYVINNENGRADRATEVAYQDQITAIYNWIKDLQDSGLLLNYGSDGTNTISGFTQQQVGMFIASSASCRNVIDSATDFEVGVANLPVPEGTEPEGVYGGGGALCIATGLSEDVETGVMEFCTYATSPEVQATWAVNTGYFPICNGAYDTETLTTAYEEMPQLQVAADQLLNSKVNSITAGPLLSQLPQLRTDLQTALEAVFNGSDVDSAVAQAIESTNSAIATANEGVAE